MRRAFLVVLMLSATLSLSFFVGCDSKSAIKFQSTDITGASFGKQLALTDAASKSPRTLASYQGKVPVFFFGYMFCPDFCPTTMAMLSSALEKMKPEEAAKVQAIFVTVDPKRDTPELLTAYVRAFNPNFNALYGTEDEIAVATKEFKIIYQKAQIKDENTYLMDHSTQMYAFDKEGRIRLLIKHGTSAEAMAADLSALVRS